MLDLLCGMINQKVKDKIFALYKNGYTTQQIIDWFQLNKNISLTDNQVLKHKPARMKRKYA